MQCVEASCRNFNGGGNLMKLVSEAYRINLAYVFDPFLAVHISEIDPLPHQISAVYQEMLPRLPLRYVLADDPGAGKTIMAGLLIKELTAREDLKRCLIVLPGSIAEQWQNELLQKFHVDFEILTNEKIESAATENIFSEINFCITKLDTLARNQVLQKKLKASDWDLIIVDEAHKMSATVWGNEIHYTKRFILGRILSGITRHFLLLTATPHNGKEKEFQLFMSLIDPDRFEGAAYDVSDVMRRLTKEELLKFDGSPLFPERKAYTVNYELSTLEAELYDEVTDYVRREFNRADKLNGKRKNTVGFALTILQRRLASSPEAIYKSLQRRRERLENRLMSEISGKKTKEFLQQYDFYGYDEDDIKASELEEIEEKITDNASAADTIYELEAEIKTLRHLENRARKVCISGHDKKWNELSLLIQDNKLISGNDGKNEKLIIFTEHKDTLYYLEGKISSLLGDNSYVVVLHGGIPDDERRKIAERFMNDRNIRILIATDAAGESINLQKAHLMVNYDLPWNPNRLEQRFGRIHRIGQTEICHLWNLVSKDTREGIVFQRLFKKLEAERKALGGKVFDILGKITFDDKSLRELLIKAIRYGNNQEVREKINETVDNTINQENLKQLLNEGALTEDSMTLGKVIDIRSEMARTESNKLQPYFIEAFFVEALRHLGGSIMPREKGTYEIIYVPSSVSNRNPQILPRYERICFDKTFCSSYSKPAELITPGHMLLKSVNDTILERYADIFKHGAVFIDDNDSGTDEKILFYIEDSVQDGSKNIISKNLNFVTVHKNSEAFNSGCAPYLDYRPANFQEQKIIFEYISGEKWLNDKNIEERAINYAKSEIMQEKFLRIMQQKQNILNRTAEAVKKRLTAEIQRCYFKAIELKHKESTGKINSRLSSGNAEKKAQELEARMKSRLSEIEREKNISALPPVVIAAALIIPAGLIRILSKTEKSAAPSVEGKRKIELAAMNIVMNIEKRLGYVPNDVSSEKRGYDIESTKQGTSERRNIEVKGISAPAESVTVSRNEICSGLNSPEEFILALVEIDGREAHTVYLQNTFNNAPDFAVASVNFNIKNLLKYSKLIYESRDNI